MTEAITCEAIAHLVPPPAQHTIDTGVAFVPAVPVPVASWWHWDPVEPYVLRLDIAQDLAGDRCVTWELSRELVQVGLVATERVGDGDVVLWSSDTDLHMQLESPSGAALLRWPRSLVSAVLAESLVSRPNGTDAPVVDEVGEWLAAISQQD